MKPSSDIETLQHTVHHLEAVIASLKLELLASQTECARLRTALGQKLVTERKPVDMGNMVLDWWKSTK